jgi:hypothetical protein
MTKFDGLIKKIYYDPGGYGTVQETYKEAKNWIVQSKFRMSKIGMREILKGKNSSEDLTVISVRDPVMSMRLICLM